MVLNFYSIITYSEVSYGCRSCYIILYISLYILNYNSLYFLARSHLQLNNTFINGHTLAPMYAFTLSASLSLFSTFKIGIWKGFLNFIERKEKDFLPFHLRMSLWINHFPVVSPNHWLNFIFSFQIFIKVISTSLIT